MSMKALVKNLGDQFNVPIEELETLNLEQFVDNAIKVEEGELATLRVKMSMKALVKNLGDQFNVPIEELETLNLEQFVDNAIKVEEGELATLRVDKGWMNSNYWRAIESDTMHYVDDDDLVTLQSNRNYYSEF
ncbi:hypothetical protein DICVIV_07827 [Dictyocaulus viviparus]|uniref:Uncharacterized protein n=1 Tax=Dictyocaulus viviparus TaxID=29172 RepID=A0A0D8XNG7_DICVI|nr:hypothetical protein DICVIV_07827 [Dictyocaulus viviparus]